MHPAYSVIFFTTASGAGYGLLGWLAALYATGRVPMDWLFGFVSLAFALGLITAGLLSSTMHLGHPERAWRAISQWRSSWLSREGVAAIVTYVPAGILGVGWVLIDLPEGLMHVAAWATVVCAAVTVWCTGMIYASLPTIRAWHQPIVAPIYLVLAVATGAVLLVALLALFGAGERWMLWAAVVALLAGLVLKLAYWVGIDSAPRTYTVEAATGLGRLGKVRPLEPAHSQPNYVMREMGFKVARKHADKLRRLSALLAFVVPAAALAGALAIGGLALPLVALAVISMAIGILAERWLFFAEAEHVAMLYYGLDRA